MAVIVVADMIFVIAEKGRIWLFFLWPWEYYLYVAKFLLFCWSICWNFQIWKTLLLYWS